jgi:hypothetical protein
LTLQTSAFKQNFALPISKRNSAIISNIKMKVASAFLSILTLGAAASLPVSLYPEAGLAKLGDRQTAPTASGNHTCKVIGTDATTTTVTEA